MRKLLFAMIAPLLFLGCKTKEVAPKPKAEFTFTTDTKGGATFTNKSTDSNTYVWDFGDLITGAAKDIYHVYNANKIFQVSLTVIGDGGTDVIVKNVQITDLKGSLMVYSNFKNSTNNIAVLIDNKGIGYINGSYPYGNLPIPDCGNIYSITVDNLSEGIHSVHYEVTNSNVSSVVKNYDVKVIGGVCTKFGAIPNN